MKGGTLNTGQGAYHNTAISGAYYVQGLIGPTSASSTRMSMVANCNGNGTTSTGYYFVPDTSSLTAYKFTGGVGGASALPGPLSYSGEKTWGSSSSHIVRVEVDGSAMSVFIDWNNDGDFDDTDESIGTKTDASYTGGYGGFRVYGTSSWIDNFEMGGL